MVVECYANDKVDLFGCRETVCY